LSPLGRFPAQIQDEDDEMLGAVAFASNLLDHAPIVSRKQDSIFIEFELKRI
jgi:hypothetical protein